MLVGGSARFRLRSRAALRDASEEFAVHVAWDGTPDLPHGAIAAPDPRLRRCRLAHPGRRCRCPPTPTDAAWDVHRLGARAAARRPTWRPEKTVLLEAGFDELHGVSWSKGCYMGQELTARTRYRGLVKRRLVPVAVDGPLPAPGTPVLGDGREVGTMRSGRDAARAGDAAAGGAGGSVRWPAAKRASHPACRPG